MGINHLSETSHQHQCSYVVCLSLCLTPPFSASCWTVAKHCAGNCMTKLSALFLRDWTQNPESLTFQRGKGERVYQYSFPVLHCRDVFMQLRSILQDLCFHLSLVLNSTDSNSNAKTVDGIESPRISREKLRNIVRWRKGHCALTGVSLSSSCEMKTQCRPCNKDGQSKI